MKRLDTIWKEHEVATRFLGMRTGFPYALDHPRVMCDLLSTGRDIQRFIDIGCGAGFFTEAVHAQWPDATAVMVDFSEPMLNEAAANVAGPTEVYRRDLADPSWSRGLTPVDAAVSGFAIHHLSDEVKRSIYRDIHRLLRPGGWFVHVEHVASASAVGAELFDRQIVDALHRYHTRNDPGVTREWVRDQYLNEADREANILSPVEAQCEWLRVIGFEDVDCFFKSYEVAIFAGRVAGGDG